MIDSTRGETSSVKVEAIKLVPSLLWIGFAALVFWVFYIPAKRLIESREISELGVGVVQIKFVKDESANIDRKSLGGLEPDDAFKPVISRYKQIAPKVIGATILWVDDKHPMQNLRERRVMSAFGLRIDMTRSTTEALNLLNAAKYDVVITNMRRDGDEQGDCYKGFDSKTAGCDLLKKMARRASRTPAIVYALNYDPAMGTPAFAMGMTNRTDTLVQFVFDALETGQRP